MLTTVLIILVVLILFVAAFMLLRTTLAMQPQPAVEPPADIALDDDLLARHLAEALKIATISAAPPAAAPERELKQLHRLLEKQYPRTHAALHRQVIGSGGLLYAWQGKNPDLPAVVLMGHLDVVPADPASLERWTHPPFSGAIADGYVWGRGALDCKGQVIAIFEAVEALLERDFQPERSIYLAFGQDEEVGGHAGAQAMAALLQEKGVNLYAVLDEGGSIVADAIPGTEGSTALVGTAEKGHLCLKLTVTSNPGHSAMPPRDTAIRVLSAALLRLDPDVMPVRMDAFQAMYRALGSRASFGMQFLMSNLWLFKGLLRRRLAGMPTAAATVRTTLAPTLIQGGVKENILPAQAQAVVNLRLLPGDSLQAVFQRVIRTVKDERVQIEALEDSGWEASPVSDTDSEVYASLSRITRQLYPDAAVVPFLVVGATDSRYFSAFCPQVFRFAPVPLTTADLGRVHGIDERISIEALGRLARFYMLILEDWAV